VYPNSAFFYCYFTLQDELYEQAVAEREAAAAAAAAAAASSSAASPGK